MHFITFIALYKEFLKECKKRGWSVEILIEDTGNYLTLIKNIEGIEVEFYIEVDFENYVQLNDKTNQTRLQYGVVRKDQEGNAFAKQVLGLFHQYLARHSSKKRSYMIRYLPKRKK